MLVPPPLCALHASATIADLDHYLQTAIKPILQKSRAGQPIKPATFPFAALATAGATTSASSLSVAEAAVASGLAASVAATPPKPTPSGHRVPPIRSPSGGAAASVSSSLVSRVIEAAQSVEHDLPTLPATQLQAITSLAMATGTSPGLDSPSTAVNVASALAAAAPPAAAPGPTSTAAAAAAVALPPPPGTGVVWRLPQPLSAATDPTCKAVPGPSDGPVAAPAVGLADACVAVPPLGLSRSSSRESNASARTTATACSTAPALSIKRGAQGGARKRSVNGQPAATSRITAQWGELHVTLWDKLKRQRIGASAYKGDLHTYLREHPHLEVYNRQDYVTESGLKRVAPRAAGVAMPSSGTGGGGGEARPVLWDTRRQCKLAAAECPTQVTLSAFLHEHSYVEVYRGQRAVTPSPGVTKAFDGSTAPTKSSHSAIAPPLPVSDAKRAGSTASRPLGLISLSKAKPLLPNKSSRLVERAPAELGCEGRPLSDTARTSPSSGWLPPAPSTGSALKELQGVLTNEVVSPMLPPRCRSAIGCEDGSKRPRTPKMGLSLWTSDGTQLTPGALHMIRDAASEMAVQPIA